MTPQERHLADPSRPEMTVCGKPDVERLAPEFEPGAVWFLCVDCHMSAVRA